MKIDGQCLCGKIAYEAHVDPARASICNCTDCQTLSGSPFRASVPARAEDFHILRGEPKVYIKTAESGAKRAQGFCGECGSPIFSSTAEDRQIYNLRLGMVTQRAQIPPQRQIWCSSALEWAQDAGKIPGVAKG